MPDFKQRILFEIHYINYAWGFQDQGLIIDSLGNIRVFNLSTKSVKWNFPDQQGYISRVDMDNNVNLCDSIVKKLNKDSLSFYVSKIWKASKGKISEPKYVMFDAGITNYSAYIFDEKTNRYKKVLIKIWGDTSVDNDAPEAEEIYQWLKRIQLEK